METLNYSENQYDNIDISSVQWLQELNDRYKSSDSIDKELIKNEVNEMLKKWYNIYSEKQYNQFKVLLNSMDIVELCPFDTFWNFIDFDEYIDLQHKFSIKLTDWLFRLFPGTNLWFIDPVQWGYILDGNFHKELSFSYSDNTADNNQFNLNLDRKSENNCLLLKSQNEDLKNINTQLLQEKDLITQKNQELIEEVKALKENAQSINWWDNEKNNNQPDAEKIEDTIPKNQEYIVKSWDTLWDLVKKNYGLSSNRDIANCVNKLVKFNIENNNSWELSTDNTPDGIFGDKIFVNQKILFAWELIFRDQIFTLKKEK